MKFIGRDTDYAIQALVFMSNAYRKDTHVVITVDEIVRRLDLPKRFMRRILQHLAKKKILSSHKGKAGGFSFLRSPARIRVIDIIEIFQGKIDLTNCFIRGRTCPNTKRCLLRKRLKEMGRFLDREFKKITLASLL